MGIRRWVRKQMASLEELEVLNAVDETPVTALGDAPESTRVRIVGTVRAPAATLRSPLTDRTCVWWSVRIEAGGHGITLRRDVPFVLEDRGHRAIVELAHARAVVERTYVRRCWIRDADPRQRAMLDQFRAHVPGDRVGFAERVITDGMKLSVVGSGLREPDPQGTAQLYRERTTWLRIEGSPAHPLYVIDEL